VVAGLADICRDLGRRIGRGFVAHRAHRDDPADEPYYDRLANNQTGSAIHRCGPFDAVFAVMFVARIEREEDMLLGHFGQAHADDQSRTGRLLPPLRR
jgi:hypothetical protein